MSSEKLKWSAILVQGLASLSIGYLTSLTGFIYAWPSFTTDNFKSNNTVLSAPMSTMEISLLGSMTNVGGLLATPLCEYALRILGRKYSAMLFGLPFVITWVIVSLTTYVPLVIAAMGIGGIGAAGQVVSSVYLAEISHDSVRGAFTSITVSGFYCGLLFSYFISGYLSYYQVIYVNLSMSILYIVLLTILVESPVYLMQKGREQEAAKSIAFYRRVDVTSKEVELEIKKIKLQLDPRLEKLLQGDIDIAAAEELLNNNLKGDEIKTGSEWKFLLKSESSKRALVTCLIVMTTSVMMGIIAIQVYAVQLFKEAVPSMESTKCTIFLGIDFVIASVLCAVIVDRLGRKFLFTTTCTASGIFTLLLGTQLELHWAPHWCTALFIYMFAFIFNIGAAVVPFILSAEVFLPEVRGFCNSLCMACMWFWNFVTLMTFNPLVETLGLGIVFCGFSIISFMGALYGQYYVPETKGLAVDDIQILFMKKNKKIRSAT